MRVIVLAAAACVAFAFANTQARADGAWCTRDSLGCTNCGFHTFAQCQANVSGMGGSCERNPARVAASDVRGRKQRNNRPRPPVFSPTPICVLQICNLQSSVNSPVVAPPLLRRSGRDRQERNPPTITVQRNRKDIP